MQEQIDRESIGITVKATKLTAKGLAKVLGVVGRAVVKHHRKAQTPQGKQSVKKLMQHGVPVNTLDISGDRGLFEQVARKWRVDYAFYKTGPEQYLLLFKSGQADAVTAAFSEYSRRVMRRAQDRRMPVMERYRRAAEHVRTQPPRERTREREAARDDR